MGYDLYFSFLFATTKERNMRKYTFTNFLVDIVLCFLTGGLWLIWIFVREMRGRS